jgi:hypothetical protein
MSHGKIDVILFQGGNHSAPEHCVRNAMMARSVGHFGRSNTPHDSYPALIYIYMVLGISQMIRNHM